MNLSAFPELLLAWVRNQGTALLGPGQQDGKASPFKAGAQYDGKVLDNMPGGRHLVQVAGQKLDMALPRNTQPGDTVRLTYLSGGPRPTFLLNQTTPALSQSPTQPVSLSSTAQQVNALMRLAGPASTSGAEISRSGLQRTGPAVDSLLTSGARLSNAPNLSALASAARTASQLASAAGATGQQPASGVDPNTAVRPIAANVVMLQGYSAMQPVQQLVPAGAVSPNTALVGQVIEGMRAAIPSSTTLTPNVLAEPSEPSRNLLPTRLFQTLSESGLFYEAHLARWAKGDISFESILREPQAILGRDKAIGAGIAELGGMSDEAARLAGKQLQLLEGAPFVWQGFAWPGQWMEWLVEERQSGEGEGEQEESSSQWVTELRLNLPRMGSIHAKVSLKGESLGLRLTTLDNAVRNEMRSALPILVKGLEAAGLKPVSLSVELADEI